MKRDLYFNTKTLNIYCATTSPVANLCLVRFDFYSWLSLSSQTIVTEVSGKISTFQKLENKHRLWSYEPNKSRSKTKALSLSADDIKCCSSKCNGGTAGAASADRDRVVVFDAGVLSSVS